MHAVQFIGRSRKIWLKHNFKLRNIGDSCFSQTMRLNYFIKKQSALGSFLGEINLELSYGAI